MAAGTDIIARGLAAKAVGDLQNKADLVNGKVPADQLPSYVDEVVEGYYQGGKFYSDPEGQEEIQGESNKIYLDLNTSGAYRYTNGTYYLINKPTAIFNFTASEYRTIMGGGTLDITGERELIIEENETVCFKVVDSTISFSSDKFVNKNDVVAFILEDYSPTQDKLLFYYLVFTPSGSGYEASIISKTVENGAQVNILEGVTVDNTELPIVDKKVNIDLTGKEDVINEEHKILSDYVDDTNQDNLFVTSNEKEVWNNKSDFSGDYNDLTNKPTIPAAQIQSDWNQSDSGAVDYIKNKPTIPAAQVQSDWNQTNTGAVDYIKNKPTIPVDTNTWRKVQLNGVDKLGTDITTKPLNLVAGNNVTITENQGAFTFSATDTTYSNRAAAQGGTAVSLVTTGEKYIWNNKQDHLTAGENITIVNNVISATGGSSGTIGRNFTTDITVGHLESGTEITADMTIADILYRILCGSTPVLELKSYQYEGGTLPSTIDNTWTSQVIDDSVLTNGLRLTYQGGYKGYIAFAYNKSLGDLTHVYQNNLTSFDLLPDLTKSTVTYNGVEYLMYVFEEYAKISAGDFYDLLWA